MTKILILSLLGLCFALTMDAQNGLKKVYNENINPIEDFYDFVFKRYA